MQNETRRPAPATVPAETIDWRLFPSPVAPHSAPDLLRAARTAGPGGRAAARDALRELALHGGHPCEVAALIVPFLPEPVGPDAADVLELLADLVDDSLAADPDAVDARWRSWSAREGVPVAQLKQQVQDWLAARHDGTVRPLRSWQAGPADDGTRDRWALQAYEAVRAALPGQLRALDDPDPAVRGAAADLLAALGEDTDTVLPALARRVQLETHGTALARVLLAVSQCAHGPGDPDAAAAVLARLQHPDRLVRAAAAIAAATHAVLPQDALVPLLHAVLLHTVEVPCDDAWPDPPANLSYPASAALWAMGEHTAKQRLTELMRKLADPVEPVDAYWAVWELTRAAFPREREPMPAFAELAVEQQQAVRMMRRFLVRCDLDGWPPVTRHNLPGRLLDFDAWCL